MTKSKGTDRLRGIKWTSLASFANRCVSSLSQFIAIPLTLGYLGVERYGIWITMTSVVAMLAIADCGVGYGLLNSLAKAYAKNDTVGERRAIFNTMAVLVFLAVVMGGISMVALLVLPWASILSTGDSMAVEAALAVFVLTCAFLVSLPMSVIQRIQFAKQEGYVSNLFQTLGAIFSLIGIFVVVKLKGNLVMLAIGSSAGPLISLLLNWLWYGAKRGNIFRGKIVSILEFRESVGILKEGGGFLVLQLAGIMVFSTDNLIMAHYFGSSAVSDYNLMFKWFQIGIIATGMFFAPLWPAYTEAITNKDMQWVRSMLIKSTVISVGVCLAGCVTLCIIIVPLIKIWTGREVHPPGMVLLSLSLMIPIIVGTTSISTYLNASNYVMKQAWLVLAHGALALIFSLVLPRWMGVAGVPMGVVLSYLIVIIPAYCFIVPRLMKSQATVPSNANEA